jgi:Resolvase, N terminal domain
MKLLDKLDEDDVLIVTKMDRLGRNAIDVKTTIDTLTGMRVRVHCLQLGGADLRSAFHTRSLRARHMASNGSSRASHQPRPIIPFVTPTIYVMHLLPKDLQESPTTGILLTMTCSVSGDSET